MSIEHRAAASSSGIELALGDRGSGLTPYAPAEHGFTPNGLGERRDRTVFKRVTMQRDKT
jgi:hypothetical protein